MENIKKTLIIGATTKADRYAYKAAERLTNHGYPIVQVALRENSNPFGDIVLKDEIPNLKSIHTVTLYLNAQNQADYEDMIMSLKPQRVIFNPGTENSAFMKKLNENGVDAFEACTLVMLATDQF